MVRRSFFESLEPRLLLVCGTEDFSTSPADLNVAANDASNSIAYLAGDRSGNAGSPVNGLTTAQVSIDGSCIEFANKSTLTIAGQAGQDQILLNNATNPTTAAGGALTTITVNGGAAFDQLTVTDVDGMASIEVTATQVLMAQPVPITYAAIESLVIDGVQGDSTVNHTLQQTLTAAAGTTILAPATALDGGLITSDALIPLTYRNLDTGGLVHIDNTAGAGSTTDRFIVRSGDSNDSLTVTSSGTNLGNIARASSGATRTPLQTTSVANLTLEGGAGDDSFTLTATTTNPLSYSTISISGGTPSASDTATLNGDGSNIAVTFNANHSVTVTGGGLGSVTLDGIEIVTVNADTGDVTINGTTGDDEMTVTVLSANAGTVQLNDVAPRVNITNTDGSPTTFDLGDASDQDRLIIIGSPLAQTFDINASDVNSVMVPNSSPARTVAARTVNVLDAAGTAIGSVNWASGADGIESLVVRGFEGGDIFNVTPRPLATTPAVPIFIDGGDPIGTSPGDTLNINAGATAATFAAGPSKDEGSVTVGTTNPPISFDHIETVNISGTGGATITGTNDDDVITVVAVDNSTHPGTDGTQDFAVTVNDGTEILFQNQPTLTIDALAGSDDIVLRTPAPAGGNAWDVDVIVNGGPPSAAGDKVVIEAVGSVATRAHFKTPFARHAETRSVSEGLQTKQSQRHPSLTNILHGSVLCQSPVSVWHWLCQCASISGRRALAKPVPHTEPKPSHGLRGSMQNVLTRRVTKGFEMRSSQFRIDART